MNVGLELPFEVKLFVYSIISSLICFNVVVFAVIVGICDRNVQQFTFKIKLNQDVANPAGFVASFKFHLFLALMAKLYGSMVRLTYLIQFLV